MLPEASVRNIYAPLKEYLTCVFKLAKAYAEMEYGTKSWNSYIYQFLTYLAKDMFD